MLAGATSDGGRVATGSGPGPGAAISCAGGGLGGGCACEQATRARRRAENDRSDRMVEPFVWMKRAVLLDRQSNQRASRSDRRPPGPIGVGPPCAPSGHPTAFDRRSVSGCAFFVRHAGWHEPCCCTRRPGDREAMKTSVAAIVGAVCAAAASRAQAPGIVPPSTAWIAISTEDLRASFDTLWAVSDVHG